jgi:hypothetical protein
MTTTPSTWRGRNAGSHPNRSSAGHDGAPRTCRVQIALRINHHCLPALATTTTRPLTLTNASNSPASSHSATSRVPPAAPKFAIDHALHSVLHLPRGILPWRFADAGPGERGDVRDGRPPLAVHPHAWVFENCSDPSYQTSKYSPLAPVVGQARGYVDRYRINEKVSGLQFCALQSTRAMPAPCTTLRRSTAILSRWLKPRADQRLPLPRWA